MPELLSAKFMAVIGGVVILAVLILLTFRKRKSTIYASARTEPCLIIGAKGPDSVGTALIITVTNVSSHPIAIRPTAAGLAVSTTASIHSDAWTKTPTLSSVTPRSSSNTLGVALGTSANSRSFFRPL